MSKRPILITGIHRSGSTFVGKMLCLNSQLGYIQEPFNKDYGLKIFETNFKYIAGDIPLTLVHTLDKLIDLNSAEYRIPSFRDGHQSVANRAELIKDFLENPALPNLPQLIERLVFKSKGQWLFYLAKYDPRINRILIKDPLACFASHFLHRRYDMDVVVLVRHPLSFAGSLKRLGWRFDFDIFLQQQQLMDDYLEEYRKELIHLNNKETTVVEEAAMLWNCIYTVIADFIDKNPTFIVYKHEQIARKPLRSFKNLYARLKLDFTTDIEQNIRKLTSTDNPVEARNNRAHQFNRNSAALIYKWQDILTADEVNYINNKTSQLAAAFYDEDPFQ